MVAKGRRSDGFTLIELMVVVLVIGILAAIAIPTFLGFRERSQNTTAKTDLKTAEAAARQVLLDEGTLPDQATLLALLPSVEPALGWVGENVPSTASRQISIADDAAGTELNLASRSDSGTCFYLRVVKDAPSTTHRDDAADPCVAMDYRGGPDTGW